MASLQQRWNSRRILCKSSGSSRADRAVEPTRSQSSTVGCRLSALALVVRVADGVSTNRLGACNEVEQASDIAFMSFFRCPRETPSFSKSCSFSSGKVSQSTSFLANTSAYWARPIRSNHCCKLSICHTTLTVPARVRSRRTTLLIRGFPAVSFLHPLDNRAVGAPRELLAQWDLLVRYRQSYTSPGRYPVMCVTHGGADRCRAHCPATRADDNRMCANVRLTVIRPRAPESRGAADSRRSSVREGGIDGVLFTPASSEDRKARRLEGRDASRSATSCCPGLVSDIDPSADAHRFRSCAVGSSSRAGPCSSRSSRG